jgi:hypothetical protein
MAIRTGIGVGAAQIADTSGIMNAYARQIAQQQRAQAAQAQREFLSAEKEKERAERAAAKFDEDIADIMASAKLGGIRNIDVEEITKAYNEVKDFNSKSGSLKDSEKQLFRAELKNRMNTINDAAINSRKVGERYYSLASKVAENTSEYDPKVIQDLDFINKTPLSKLGALANMDPITYQKLPNFGLIDNIIDDTYKIGKENAKFAGEVFDKGKRFNVEKVDPALIQNNLVQRFTTSPEALRAISNLYSRELGKQPTNQELTNYIMDKYKTKHGFDYIGEARDLKEPKSDGGENIFSQPIELNIPFAQETKAPGSLNVKDYVKLPLSKQNFAGSGYIELATGKPSSTVLESSNDYEVVGVGNFPFIKKGSVTDKSLEGALSQKTFAEKNPNAIELKPMVHVQRNTAKGQKEDLLIPYDRLPASSKVKKGLTNFTPASGSKPTPGVPAATRAEWKAAGWSDSDINEGIKQKVIKVK